MIDVRDSLRHIALFAAMSDELLTSVVDHLEEMKLAEGGILFEKGDPGDAMFLIVMGVLKIYGTNDDGTEVEFNRMGPGQAIGQMSVIDVEPRTASVAALADTSLLKLSHQAFMDVLAEEPPERLEELREVSQRMRLGYLDILKELPIFQDLPDDVIAEMAVKLEPMDYEENDVVFRKGDPGDALYIITDGRVKIVTEDGSGEELILNQVGPGEYFGEMSLIDEQPRSAGVVALGHADMLKLDREEFMYVIASHPEIALDVMRTNTRRLRFNTTYIEQAIEWAKRIGEGDYESAMKEIESTQSDVAVGEFNSDETRAAELLSAFFSLVENVREREEELKRELRRLSIQIDEDKRKQDVQAVTSSEYYTRLKENAQRIKEDFDK